MEFVCAECGCVVDRGVVTRRREGAHCCCADLPDRAQHAMPRADVQTRRGPAHWPDRSEGVRG